MEVEALDYSLKSFAWHLGSRVGIPSEEKEGCIQCRNKRQFRRSSALLSHRAGENFRDYPDPSDR